MPVQINYVIDYPEISGLIDKLARDSLCNKNINFNWQEKLLSGNLLKLSVGEYAQLPVCLQNKCLQNNDHIYITDVDYLQKDLLQEDFDDWQLAQEEGLRILDKLRENKVLDKTTGFKVKRNSSGRDGVTKYNYYIILNVKHEIHDVIRILPKEHIGFGVYGKVRLGLSLHTGNLYALKIQVAKHEKFDTKTLRQLDKEREVLIEQNQLLGIVNRVGLYRKASSLQQFSTEKAVSCMPYYTGEQAYNYITKEVEVSSFQKKLTLLQMAIEIARIHNKNIIHLDIKPQNFQQDIVASSSGMVKVKLIDFGNATRSGGIIIPYSFTPLYAAPEVSTFFILKSKTDNHNEGTLTSHDIRIIDATQGKSRRPSGAFFPANKPVDLCTDVYSFGNMLLHDYDIDAPFVFLMLNKDPTLRPAMSDMPALLVNYFIENETLSEDELLLLITFAKSCNNVNYEWLRDCLFIVDKIYNQLSLEQRSYLLLHQSHIIHRLQLKAISSYDMYIAFLLLKINELHSVLQQEQLPRHGCCYWLFHPQERKWMHRQEQKRDTIEHNLYCAEQILQPLVSQEDKKQIIADFVRFGKIITNRYQLVVANIDPGLSSITPDIASLPGSLAISTCLSSQAPRLPSIEASIDAQKDQSTISLSPLLLRRSMSVAVSPSLEISEANSFASPAISNSANSSSFLSSKLSDISNSYNGSHESVDDIASIRRSSIARSSKMLRSACALTENTAGPALISAYRHFIDISVTNQNAELADDLQYRSHAGTPLQLTVF